VNTCIIKIDSKVVAG
jgi:hypothetical protein